MKGIKVALVGNMNNINSGMKGYLEDLGYEVTLFYQIHHPHFTVEADYFSLSRLSNIYKVNWLGMSWPLSETMNEKIRTIFLKFDFIIATGREAAYLSFAGVHINMYIPFGGDIQHMASGHLEFSLKKKLVHIILPNRSYRQVKYGTWGKFVRRAIINADYIMMEESNDSFESDLIKIPFKGKRILCTPPIFHYLDPTNHFLNSSNCATHWSDVVDKLRLENSLLILYHGRQSWSFSGENSDRCWDDMSKNVHFLIHGLKIFITNNNKISCKLIMIEYGPDIEQSKELIKDLGLSDYVIWFPIMYRKDLLYIIHNSDICCGEFNLSFLSFGTIVEAGLMGKPILHYRDDSLYNSYPELYPILNCRKPDEIAEKINFYINNKEECRKMGEKAKDWMIKYFVNKSINIVDNIIKNWVNDNTTEHFSKEAG